MGDQLLALTPRNHQMSAHDSSWNTGRHKSPKTTASRDELMMKLAIVTRRYSSLPIIAHHGGRPSRNNIQR